MLLELFTAVVVLICIYTIRHYCFTVNRPIGQERHPYVDVEIMLGFDADYVPSKALIGQLVASFVDPEVRSVMGRVVPLNVGKKLLTRILELERSGGYQVDQQARMILHFVPQYGGTGAGIRKSALDEIGGWNENTLAEDTDLTYRMLLAGWKTV